MKTELAKCPICDGPVYKVPQSTLGGLRVACKDSDCRFIGPPRGSSEQAAEAWNTLVRDIETGQAVQQKAAEWNQKIDPGDLIEYCADSGGYIRVCVRPIPEPPVDIEEVLRGCGLEIDAHGNHPELLAKIYKAVEALE